MNGVHSFPSELLPWCGFLDYWLLVKDSTNPAKTLRVSELLTASPPKKVMLPFRRLLELKDRCVRKSIVSEHE